MSITSMSGTAIESYKDRMQSVHVHLSNARLELIRIIHDAEMHPTAAQTKFIQTQVDKIDDTLTEIVKHCKF